MSAITTWLADPAHLALLAGIALTLVTLFKLVLPGGPLVGRIKLSPAAVNDLGLGATFLTAAGGALNAGATASSAVLAGFAALGLPAALISRQAHKLASSAAGKTDSVTGPGPSS